MTFRGVFHLNIVIRHFIGKAIAKLFLTYGYFAGQVHRDFETVFFLLHFVHLPETLLTFDVRLDVVLVFLPLVLPSGYFLQSFDFAGI